MKDLKANELVTAEVQDAELQELEAALRRFRPSPMPDVVQKRMISAVTAERPRAVQKNYCRYIAPVAAMLMLSVVAFNLPQVPDTPTPLYVPILACLSGILMLTVMPRRGKGALAHLHT